MRCGKNVSAGNGVMLNTASKLLHLTEKQCVSAVPEELELVVKKELIWGYDGVMTISQTQ
jgi:hypothetical protein